MARNILTAALSLLLVAPVGAQTLGATTVSSESGADANVAVTRTTAPVAKRTTKEAVEAARIRVKERMDAQKVQLQERLKQVNVDDRKKQMVEKINTELTKLNEVYTKRMANAMDVMEKTVTRIEERVKKAVERGLDVAAVNAAIGEAKTGIIAGRAAVEAQAAKVYTVEITTVTNLRADITKVRMALRNDLANMRDIVKVTRDLVRQAAVAFGQMHGQEKDRGGVSPSVETTPAPTQ